MSRRRKRTVKKKAKQKHAGKRSPSISVCMIVKNEEKFLPRCLESIRNLVDEIIIVDTGSTDNTIQIAQSFGAKVYQHPWENDFAKHRNQSLNYATGEWVLVLDADEVIPKKEIHKLRQAVEIPFGDAYRMTTRNYRWEPTEVGTQKAKGEYEEEKDYPYWVPSTKVRLFRKLPGVAFRGEVHELVEPWFHSRDLKIADLDVPVLHFGDVSKSRPRDRYLHAALQKTRGLSKNPKAFYELGVIQLKAEKYREALESAELALDLCQMGKNEGYEEASQLYALKGSALLKLGRYDEAAEAYKKSLEINPHQHEFANNLGVCHEYKGDFVTALSWYNKALDLQPDATLTRENIRRVKKKIRREKTLSVCMIVRDEEKNIRMAIESVKPFADEIVVVDTGSMDQTVEIARSLGAKVGHFQWCDDFSAARNASLDMATGDWIMWLDADDYVPPTEWPKLQEIKFLPLDQGFMFRLQNQGPSKEVLLQLRMFPNHPKIRFRYPVHEQVAPALRELGFPLRKVDINIVHTGYSSRKVIQEKKEKYLNLLQQRIKENPKDLMSRFHVGFIFHSTGRFREAAEQFEMILRNESFARTHSATYLNALTHLGRAYLQLDRPEDALQVLEKARGWPQVPGLVLVSLAEAYNKLGMPEKAVKVLGEFGGHSLLSNVPTNVEALRYAVEYQRALAFKQLGDLENAIYACRKAQRISEMFREAEVLARDILTRLGRKPVDLQILSRIARSPLANADDLYEYGNALVRCGRLKEAKEAYQKALSIEQRHVKSRRALALILKRGNPQKARTLLEQGLSLDPYNPDLASDLADLLFDMEQWPSILDLPTCNETLPTRLAARLIGDMHDGMEHDIVALFGLHGHSLEELDRDGPAALWRLAEGLEDPARFHLAVACFWIQPSLKQAAKAAVQGFLARGRAEKALRVAEQYISTLPGDGTGLELLARCCEKIERVEPGGNIIKGLAPMKPSA